MQEHSVSNVVLNSVCFSEMFCDITLCFYVLESLPMIFCLPPTFPIYLTLFICLLMFVCCPCPANLLSVSDRVFILCASPINVMYVLPCSRISLYVC